MKKKAFFTALFATVLCSCSDKDALLDKTDYTISCNDSIQISGTKDMVVEDNFVATFENGFIKGHHIGETTAVYNEKQPISITVKPTVSYIAYPVTSWGATMNEVESLHGGTPTRTTSTVFYYTINTGSKIKYMYMYNFEDGKLKSVGLLVPYTDAKILAQWLSEKYYLVLTGDSSIFSIGIDSYKTSTATTTLGISTQSVNSKTYYTSYAYLVIFAPNSSSSTKAVQEDMFVEILNGIFTSKGK